MDVFKRQMSTPDHVLITGVEAKKQFGLGDQDLENLSFYEKENPYDVSGPRFRQYMLPDIVRVAVTKHRSPDTLIARYEHFLVNEARRARSSAIYGADDPVEPTRPIAFFSILGPRRNPPPLLPPVSGLRSIQQGLVSNGLIAMFKSIIFGLTGSSAIFADLCHSSADVANYAYRYHTVVRAERKKADKTHPYGYARLRDVAADRSFFLLLSLGGVLPLFHAVREFLVPEVVLACALSSSAVGLSLSMFAVSGYLELVACRAAVREIRALKGASMTFSDYVQRGTDVMPVATLLESGTGVFAAGLGSLGIVASFLTGNVVFDLAASAVMASSVLGVSGFLLSRSQQALIGRTVPMDVVRAVTEVLEKQSSVVAVYDIKTEILGAETVRFKAEIEFNAEEITKFRLDLANQPENLKSILQTIGKMHKSENFEDWIMKNDANFLLALTGELKRLENLIRAEIANGLGGCKNIHVDLEPW
jgi:zinc transporter 9